MSRPTLYYQAYQAPTGPLGLAVDEQGRVVLIAFVKAGRSVEAELSRRRPNAEWRHEPARLAELTRQLDEYFAGRRRRFELELAPVGTPFEMEVWRALQEIPLGETRSYGELARQLGKPGSARAVGRANGANPLPIVVPCHRVIGSDGSLTGFGGGLPIKRELLRREGVPVQGLLLDDDPG